MSREAHVRFCESAGVKLPRATHPIEFAGANISIHHFIIVHAATVNVMVEARTMPAGAHTVESLLASAWPRILNCSIYRHNYMLSTCLPTTR